MIRKSKALYIGMTVLGLLFIAFGILSPQFMDSDKFAGYVMGIGAAFAVLGSLILFRIARHPDYLKKQEIEKKDERAIKIRERAAFATFWVTMFGLAAITTALLFMNYDIPSLIVSGFMLVVLFVFFVLTAYFKRKY